MRKHNGKGDVLRGLLSRNIRQSRLLSGLSQEQLAEKAGVSLPYIGAIERGEKWPSAETFIEIACGLGVDPYILLMPENASAQKVQKIITKLTRDISAMVNQSVKLLNTVTRESADPEGKKAKNE
jgi:transcriptional regulator with XRE-family HTH domain